MIKTQHIINCGYTDLLKIHSENQQERKYRSPNSSSPICKKGIHNINSK